VALIDFGALDTTRSQVMRRLREKSIGTQVHYIPVHLQPYYRDRYETPTLPGAERYYERCLSLPLFPTMVESDVDRVVEALAEVLGLQVAADSTEMKT
jgi:dTDP-4-amino-4,6-dideoxygalactose transaminase